MIIVCGGVKGGTGKTTTAANLGIERARRGAKILLVDADPDQESLTDYIANRDEHKAQPSVSVIQVKGTTTSKSLVALSKDYDDVLVDCGGFDSVELRQAVLVCQAWIVPLNPTQMQVWTMPKLAWFIFGHFWVTDGRAEAAGPLRLRPDLPGRFCHGGGQPRRLRRAGSAAVRGPAG